MTTAERSIPKELTDEEADRLAEIPEVANAIKEFQSIQSEFRRALLDAWSLESTDDESTRVSEVIDEFQARLDDQKLAIVEVARRHYPQ